jgi:manganese transport protein
MFGAKREIMGELVNPRWLSALVAVLASLIIALNVFLLYEFVAG